MQALSHNRPPSDSPDKDIRIFVSPVAEDYRGPEWPDEVLKDWIAYYQRERAAALDASTDRTAGTVAFCEHRMDVMLTELERRKRLAERFRHDPRGPSWSTAGAERRTALVELAQDLKREWSIDRFLRDLMLVELIPAGRNRWTCRCFTGTHKDTTPSMTVYGDDGHVHCFGCRFSGDVIDITKLYFGVESFTEAVRRLAVATGREMVR